jgi:hypothetical protein
MKYGDPDFWTGVLRNRIITRFPKFLAHVMPASEKYSGATARYVGVEIDDQDNADGYSQIGFGMVGPVWQSSINYGENNGYGVTPLTDMSETLGGKRNYWDRGKRRTWNGAFGFLSADETFYTLTRLIADQGDSNPVFIMPDQTDVLHLQSRCFLSSVKSLSPIQQLLGNCKNATGLSFEEWL